MLRTRAPLVIIVLLQHVTVQLACIKPAASVHPEPGSNSPLYNISLPRRAFSLFFVSVLSFAFSFLKRFSGIFAADLHSFKELFPFLESLIFGASFWDCKSTIFFFTFFPFFTFFYLFYCRLRF